MLPHDQAPAALKRRTFFARVITLAGVTSLIPAFLRGAGRSRTPLTSGDEKRVQVKLNPLAVPRTSKGSTGNG